MTRNQDRELTYLEKAHTGLSLEKELGFTVNKAHRKKSQSGCVYSPKECISFDPDHLKLMVKRTMETMQWLRGNHELSFVDGSSCKRFLLS